MILVAVYGTFILCLVNVILGFSKLAIMVSLRNNIEIQNELVKQNIQMNRHYFELSMRESRIATETVRGAAKTVEKSVEAVAPIADEQRAKAIERIDECDKAEAAS